MCLGCHDRGVIYVMFVAEMTCKDCVCTVQSDDTGVVTDTNTKPVIQLQGF